MILQDLQTYLKQQHRASLQEIEQKFHIEADALRAMLNPLIRKGRVRKLAGQPCTQCHSCAPESLEFYEWVNSASG